MEKNHLLSHVTIMLFKYLPADSQLMLMFLLHKASVSFSLDLTETRPQTKVKCWFCCPGFPKHLIQTAQLLSCWHSALSAFNASSYFTSSLKIHQIYRPSWQPLKANAAPPACLFLLSICQVFVRPVKLDSVGLEAAAA